MSNDNPFSESQFKTLKYQPDFPGRFRDAEHARAWCAEFFDWYNHHHQHSALALFTAADDTLRGLGRNRTSIGDGYTIVRSYTMVVTRPPEKP